jgi:hypothetical protein
MAMRACGFWLGGGLLLRTTVAVQHGSIHQRRLQQQRQRDYPRDCPVVPHNPINVVSLPPEFNRLG